MAVRTGYRTMSVQSIRERVCGKQVCGMPTCYLGSIRSALSFVKREFDSCQRACLSCCVCFVLYSKVAAVDALLSMLVEGRPSSMTIQTPQRANLLLGTLDMLILRTLLWGPAHGHQIGKHIQRTTDNFLQMQHGSLYPALRVIPADADAGKFRIQGSAGALGPCTGGSRAFD